MNKIWLCLIGLILVGSSFQIAASSSNPSSYDVMADVNRDRIVDVNDLSRLGKAYGSNLVLPSEAGKAVVTVLSFGKEPPEIENARVAAVDPELLHNQWENPINVTCTNSSGIATFDLSPNKNYTAIAWSASAYSYANFTTNSLGEASVMILLAEPSMLPVHALPEGWVVVTLLNNETNSLYFEEMRCAPQEIIFNQTSRRFYSEPIVGGLAINGGVFVIPLDKSLNKPYSKMGLWIFNVYGTTRGSPTYSPDEDGCANVVVYVIP